MAVVMLKNEQVATLCNESIKNTLGENATILSEDLSNFDIFGTSLANANVYTNFLENLMIATAKYIFRFRAYDSKAPRVLRDTQEFGRLIQKIRSKLPKLSDNQSYQLTDGASYDDNVFIANEVEVKIFKERVAFEVRKSITNDQIKDAFTSAEQLNNFVSMQFGLVRNRLTLALDDLIYMTLSVYIGMILKSVHQVKLLTAYKANVPGADMTLTSDNCLFDKGFLTYASSELKDGIKLMQRYSTQFNEENFETFTPEDLLHVVLLSKFKDNMEMYAESSTFHNDFIKLPYGEEVVFWQGLGNKSIKDRSTIDITLPDGTAIKQSYIVAFMFDHDALGVNYDNPSVETKYVRSGQFTNYWFKEVLGYFADMSENAVVYTLE